MRVAYNWSTFNCVFLLTALMQSMVSVRMSSRFLSNTLLPSRGNKSLIMNSRSCLMCLKHDEFSWCAATRPGALR